MTSVQLNLTHYGEYAVVHAKNTQTPTGVDASKTKICVGFNQDVSGSMVGQCAAKEAHMAGTRLRLCQETMKYVASRLTGHQLGLTTFDSGVSTPIQLSPVTEVDAIHRTMDSLRAGSCTNFSGGMHASLQMMKSTQEADVKYLITLTDGHANEGITDLPSLLQMIKKALDEIPGSTKLILLGYGSDCNSDFLQSIATETGGSYHYLGSAEDIPEAIGEEFGTALQTRQQNLTLRVPPAVATLIGRDSVDGVAMVGDLLMQENKDFLYEVHDKEAFQTAVFGLTYLDCETGETHILETTGSDSVEQEMDVLEAVHVQNVADVLQEASHLPMEECRLRLEACLARLACSSTKDLPVTQRLIKTLQDQLNGLELRPPATLRSCSESTRQQRGGHFAPPAVELYRSLTTAAVSDSMQAPQAPQAPPTPHGKPVLYRC